MHSVDIVRRVGFTRQDLRAGLLMLRCRVEESTGSHHNLVVAVALASIVCGCFRV